MSEGTETVTSTSPIGTSAPNLDAFVQLLVAQGFDVGTIKDRITPGMPEAMRARFINESGVKDLLNAMLRDLAESWAV